MGVFYTRPALVSARARWKREGKTVVFTNGCYDLLHPGHIERIAGFRPFVGHELTKHLRNPYIEPPLPGAVCLFRHCPQRPSETAG